MARFSSILWMLCFLVCSGLALDCNWGVDPHQGLDMAYLERGALPLEKAWRDLDPDSCRTACCAEPDCDLVQVRVSAEGVPLCLLVRCVIGDRDVCVLQPSTEDRVYRRNRTRTGTDPEHGKKTLLRPLMGHLETSVTTATTATNQSTDSSESSEERNVRCRLPKKVGHCRAAFPKFFYDSTDQSCQGFIFGGCDANANNFDSKQECEDSCGGVTGPVLPDESTPAPPLPVNVAHLLPVKSVVEPAASGSVVSKRTEQCMVAPDPGSCRAAFPKFYYDPNTSTCHNFIYGGCHGNRNRYDSLEECMSHCSGDGEFEGREKPRNRWTAGVFLFVTLASISALLLGTLIILTLRRHRLPRRPSSISDKEELLHDDSSSLESLSVPQSPEPHQA
ncbi:kunitz-type protease inhibitor 2 [Tautogolabrus adspersus]